MLSLLIPVLIIAVVVVFLMRRGGEGRSPGSGDGEDLLAYLILAVAVGVATFSLMNLGRAAFPTGSFVTNPERQIAAALAGLIVSVPVAIYLWRRQRARRDVFPRSGGWTLYLALVEAVFMTAFAISLHALLAWWLASGNRVHFTDIAVFAGILVFHEVATKVTPPRSGGFELPRIIGSAIGLIALAIGASALLTSVLDRIFRYSTSIDFGSTLAILITGAVVWVWRWLRPWPEPAGHARNGWTFLVATLSLGALLGSLGVVISRLLTFFLTSTVPARPFFNILPMTLAVTLVASAIWIHHRMRLGRERTHPVRAYEYFTAAQGLSAAVVAGVALATALFSRSVIAGGREAAAIYSGTFILLGLGMWWFFWKRAELQPRESEILAPPRRTYLLGVGVLMATAAAIALIITLVGVFQIILGVGDLSTRFPTTISLVLAAGGAAWHLLSRYVKDKESVATGETIAAFDVTLICSHPGVIATRFPDQARVRVVYRGDDLGLIDDEMADRIVAAVNNRPSFVWVDESGFRLAPIK